MSSFASMEFFPVNFGVRNNDCPKCISDSNYVQSLWTVIMDCHYDSIVFIMTVQNDCPFCEMKISSHKNVRPLFIVKSEFLGYNAFNLMMNVYGP